MIKLIHITSSPRVKKLLRFGAKVVAVYLIIVLVLGIFYRFVPPVSTLMLGRWLTLQSVNYQPVDLKQVSPQLLQTVIRAEDGRFCDHFGVDWGSLFAAIREGGFSGPTRGASTIPMQVTKNLFLWPQQSVIRKAIEIPLAIYLNAIWPKERMMEVYLSIAEWGDGIYGVEAASQKYFRKSARALNRREASLLAAALPNPEERDPRRVSGYYREYFETILKWSNANVDTSCLR